KERFSCISTMICRIGVLGRDAPDAMKGAPTPARPSAPTPFKKARRPIPLVGLADSGVRLVFDPLEVPKNCFSFWFIVRHFPPFAERSQDELEEVAKHRAL